MVFTVASEVDMKNNAEDLAAHKCKCTDKMKFVGNGMLSHLLIAVFSSPPSYLHPIYKANAFWNLGY